MDFFDGRYTLFWFYDSATDQVHFKIVVRNSTGWAGVGFSTSKNTSVSGFDFIVGGLYPNGTAFVRVCLQSDSDVGLWLRIDVT